MDGGAPDKASMPGGGQRSPRLALLLRWLLPALLLAVALAYLAGSGEVLARLGGYPAWVVVAVMLLRLTGFMLFVAATWLVLRPLAPRAGFVEFYQLSVSSFLFGNFTGAGGGIAVKALYLKRLHDLPYLRFAGIQVMLVAVMLGLAGLIALLGVGALTLTGTKVAWVLVLACLGALGLGLAPALSARWYRPDRLRAHPKLLTLIEGWEALLTAGALRCRLLVLMALRGMTGFLALGCLFYAMQATAPGFLLGGTIDALTTVLQVVRVTPGNLGIYEWCIGLFSEVAHFPLVDGLLSAVLYRFCGLTAIAASGALLHLSRLWPRSI